MEGTRLIVVLAQRRIYAGSAAPGTHLLQMGMNPYRDRDHPFID